MTDYSFPVSAPVDVVAKFGYGSLVVNADDDVHEVTAVLTAREPDSDVLSRTTVELRGSQLLINGPRPKSSLFELPVFGGSGSKDAVDIVVRVPARSELKTSTFAADVTTHGQTGTVDIASGTSTVDVDRVDGDVRIRFGSGPIRIASVSRATSIRTGSSDVVMGEAQGTVDVRFGAGSLEIDTAHGAVRMKTGAGSARIARAESDVDLTSGTGEIAIGIPAGHQAQLDVMTGTGRLHTDMPVEQVPRADTGRVSKIRAMTGSGDVVISRATL